MQGHKIIIMENTIIRSLILFFSIPLFNVVTSGFSTIFHDIHHTIKSVEQFETYEFSLVFMLLLLAIAIPLIEGLYDSNMTTRSITILLYLGVFFTIAVVTFNQFSFRPYEHSLTFLSIVSIVLTREIICWKLISRI